jgi:hypothetical protein
VRQIIGDVLKKGFQARQELGERTAGAVQEFGERAAGVVDTLYGVVPATYGAVTQAFARTAQTPEQAEKTGQVAASAIDKPIGKAFGITNKPTYQQPLGGITQPVAEQINKVVSCLKPTSRIYWRLNPGRYDHDNEECQNIPFFPWTFEKLREFADKHNYKQTVEKIDEHPTKPRLYAEWHRTA